MRFWRLAFILCCVLVAACLNRYVFLDASETEQLLIVLAGVALLIICFITLMLAYIEGLSAGSRSAVLVGWALTGLLAIDTVSSLSHFQYRADLARMLQHTPFARFAFESNGMYVLDGFIGDETLESLIDLLHQHGNRPLLINSPGGVLDAATKVAAIVRKHGLTVVVTVECSSACVLIAAASDNLLAFPEAEFGFHQASLIVDDKSSFSKFMSRSANETMMQQLARSGIPDAVLEMARRTPPEDMFYVTAEQMKSFGIVKRIIK